MSAMAPRDNAAVCTPSDTLNRNSCVTETCPDRLVHRVAAIDPFHKFVWKDDVFARAMQLRLVWHMQVGMRLGCNQHYIRFQSLSRNGRIISRK